MGHRQDMTPRQRLEWDVSNYKKRLEANRGSNYQYWNQSYNLLLDKGYDLYDFRLNRFHTSRNNCEAFSTSSEEIAKEVIIKLRQLGYYARIICGYDQNIQRIKMYSIIYKKKQRI